MPTGSEFARPRRFDMSELRRLGVWGIAAIAGLVMVAFAASTDFGEERLALLLAKAVAKPERFAARPTINGPNAAEARKLAEAVQLLTVDRDRLAARLETLERNLGEVTGSVGKPTQPATPVSPTPTIAPPDTAAVTPLPLSVEPATNRQEFGLDLGTAPSVEGLRALWTSIRSKHAGTLDILRPIVAIRENARTGGVEFRLVAGPIANAAGAAKLCAVLVGTGAICQPAVFDSQRLVMR